MTVAACLRAVLASVLVGLVVAAAAEGATRVRLITTGGTIANAAAGRLSPDDLVRALPGHGVPGVEIEREEFANASSASFALQDWVRLSRRVTTLFADDPGLAGIVVTTGTDTLEELALFLHLTVAAPRPVVLVGAMRRPGAPDADGPRNLFDALLVASARSSRERGTLVVMHGQVHAAAEARKLHATRLGAFDAPAALVLGTVEGGHVRYSGAPAPRPGPGALALGEDVELPRVDVLLTYQGATGDLVQAAVDAGARGIVLASAGAGSLTPSQAAAAGRVADRGIAIVVATRTGAGVVAGPERGTAEFIPARGLPALKARVLLMLALARGLDRGRIAALFEEASDALPR